MILPNKSIKLENSLLGAGAILIKELEYPQTVSSLWERTKMKQEINNFEKFVLTLDFLHLTNVVFFEGDLITKR